MYSIRSGRRSPRERDPRALFFVIFSSSLDCFCIYLFFSEFRRSYCKLFVSLLTSTLLVILWVIFDDVSSLKALVILFLSLLSSSLCVAITVWHFDFCAREYRETADCFQVFILPHVTFVCSIISKEFALMEHWLIAFSDKLLRQFTWNVWIIAEAWFSNSYKK